jgi:EF-hand domain/EF hand
MCPVVRFEYLVFLSSRRLNNGSHALPDHLVFNAPKRSLNIFVRGTFPLPPQSSRSTMLLPSSRIYNRLQSLLLLILLFFVCCTTALPSPTLVPTIGTLFYKTPTSFKSLPEFRNRQQLLHQSLSRLRMSFPMALNTTVTQESRDVVPLVIARSFEGDHSLPNISASPLSMEFHLTVNPDLESHLNGHVAAPYEKNSQPAAALNVDVPYFASIRDRPMPLRHSNGVKQSSHLEDVLKVAQIEMIPDQPLTEIASVVNDAAKISIFVSSRRHLSGFFATVSQWGRRLFRRNSPVDTSVTATSTTLTTHIDTSAPLDSIASIGPPSKPITFRSIWRRREARSAEEGIRREHITQQQQSSNHMRQRKSARQLSSVLAKANASIERTSRRVAARTLTGLITAMAEEVRDLNVEVDARDETPYRQKHITAVRIQFSRLGFKPLRMGGHDSPDDHRQQRQAVSNHHSQLMHQLRMKRQAEPKEGDRAKLMGLLSWDESDYDDDLLSDEVSEIVDHIDADEAFDRIDVDNSGFLDRKELIQALGLAAIVSNDKALVLEDMESDSHVSILEELASDLFELYDVNGDGVVDRREYKLMVEDMAALRNRDIRRRRGNDAATNGVHEPGDTSSNWLMGPFIMLQNRTGSMLSAGIELLQNKTGFVGSGLEFIQEKKGFLSTGVSAGVEFVQNKTGSLATGVSAGVEFVQNKTGFLYTGVEYVQNTTGYLATTGIDFLQNTSGFTEYVQNNSAALTNSVEFVKGKLAWPLDGKGSKPLLADGDTVVLGDVPEVVESFSKSLGSITFTDIKMDLRRLFFGAIPIIKHIVPGGPLILEPFSTTITGSFNRHDIMNSYLLDAGLRRLVMRALRRRVGFLRDLLEGAMFKGRSWKTYGDETGGGPRVEIPELTNVEFDENDKLIITGRARVQTSPDASVIHQSFKVRTSIGTRKNGRYIRLEEPELALVIECPESWEKK